MQSFIEKYNIKEEYAELPENYRAVLENTPWEQQIWDIAKKQGLLLDETNIVIEEVGLVLLGAEPRLGLRDNIIHATKMLDKEADELIRALNAFVFTPLQDAVKKTVSNQPTHKEILAEIEDKPDTKPKETVVHKKLSEIFAMKPATSDYSKESEVPTSYAEGQDPYHEPID